MRLQCGGSGNSLEKACNILRKGSDCFGTATGAGSMRLVRLTELQALQCHRHFERLRSMFESPKATHMPTCFAKALADSTDFFEISLFIERDAEGSDKEEGVRVR